MNTRNFPQFIAHFHSPLMGGQWRLAGNFHKICQKIVGYYYKLVTFVTISPVDPSPRGSEAPMRALHIRKLPPMQPREPPAKAHFLPQFGRKTAFIPQICPIFSSLLRKKVPSLRPRPFKNPGRCRIFRPFFTGSIPGLIPRLTCKHKFLKGI